MSRFFPRAPQAKDQKYARVLIGMDILTHGFQAGSMAGPGIGVFCGSPKILRSTGVCAIAGMVTAGTATAHVWELGETEWKQRSWNRLGDKRGVEIDDWIYTGMAVGMLGAFAIRRGVRWTGVVGGAGVGSRVGPVAWWSKRKITRKWKASER